MIRALALCLIASPALADGLTCIPRAELIAKLDTGFGQVQMVRAAESRGGIIEVYVSPKGGWTMVVIPPAAGPLKACLIASGTGFMMIAPGIDG